MIKWYHKLWLWLLPTYKTTPEIRPNARDPKKLVLTYKRWRSHVFIISETWVSIPPEEIWNTLSPQTKMIQMIEKQQQTYLH